MSLGHELDIIGIFQAVGETILRVMVAGDDDHANAGLAQETNFWRRTARDPAKPLNRQNLGIKTVPRGPEFGEAFERTPVRAILQSGQADGCRGRAWPRRQCRSWVQWPVDGSAGRPSTGKRPNMAVATIVAFAGLFGRGFSPAAHPLHPSSDSEGARCLVQQPRQ